MRGVSAAGTEGAGVGVPLPGGEVALGVEGGLGGHLGAGNTLSVQILAEVEDHVCLDLECTRRDTVMDTLRC